MTAPKATFTYWDDDDASPIAEHLAHWREHFPGHAILTRMDARQLLERRSPQFLDAFDRIALPACRSDIARLLRLEALGGLYVDAHCAIIDLEGIATRFEWLETCDIVVSTRYAPKFAQIMPHNSIVWARPRSSILRLLLDTALANLAAKASRERLCGFESYHVWDITGPGVFWHTLFEVEMANGRLKDVWKSRVFTTFETDNPVQRHHFVGYRASGNHWSERQETELLFQDVDSAGPESGA